MATAIIQGDIPICHQCGEQFPKRTRGPSKFCSKACWTASERDKRIVKRRAAGLRVEGDTQPCVSCSAAVPIKRGQTKYCDPCRVEAEKAKAIRWKEKNPGKRRLIQRNADVKKKQSPSWRAWRREYARSQWAERRKDPKMAIDHRMGQLVRTALREAKAGRRWEQLVDYSLADLMTHLERQFLKGMGWHNMGQWHIDHIVPRAAFTYTSEEDDEFKACWALSNLRPLWAKENMKKSDQRLYLI